jgi:hypothetical protein
MLAAGAFEGLDDGWDDGSDEGTDVGVMKVGFCVDGTTVGTADVGA